MDRFRIPPVSGGTRGQNLDRTLALGLLGLVALLLIGGLGAGVLIAHGPSASLAAPSYVRGAPHPLAVPAPFTHGDLVVTAANSPFVISPATTGSSVYGQGGNVTVQSGGTLIVRNISFDFVQFIGNTGDAVQRSSHVYRLTDQGTVTFQNAVVTTDAQIINAYTKLLVNVSGGGVLTAESTTFAFPGWINVYGAGSMFNATHSLIERNSAGLNFSENASLAGDNRYAPSISVSGGAHAILAATNLVGSYKDNTTAAGIPGMNPLISSTPQSISSGGGASWTTWQTQTDSENLSLDLAYPAITAGWVSIDYSTSASQSAATNSLVYGASFPLGAISFPAPQTVVNASLPAAAIAAINAGGLPAFLDASGAFGASATLSVSLGATNSATAVAVSSVTVQLRTALDYNITVSGAGTVFTAVDSSLDLNWNRTPGSVGPVGSPLATSWGSNKLLITNGAEAFLANISIPAARTNVYWNSSAVLPDATSTANFYRWSVIPVTAIGNVPIPGASVAAYYAYDSSQLNNQTATSLNALAASDPELWGYAASVSPNGYGTTNGAGNGALLLASGVLTMGSLPDGVFLGGYHVSVSLGPGPGSTQWGFASVTAYPGGMDPASPDFASTVNFPNYAPSLSVGPISVGVANTTVTEVLIGQTLQVTALITNSGQGPVGNSTAQLVYTEPGGLAPHALTLAVSTGSLAAGSHKQVEFNWTVDESVTGTRGTFNATLAVIATCNGGGGPTGGQIQSKFDVKIGPSNIQLILSPAFPAGDLTSGPVYVLPISVSFNGSGLATVILNLVGPDGTPYPGVGNVDVTSGGTGDSVDFKLPGNLPGGTYSLNASASYNNRTVWTTFTGAFTVAGPAAASPSFLDQTFLGLKVLYWILIAVAIVVAILVALLLLRQTARGKLVECGECGQLIPENALACPKCGAEFESDLVRCSRCGSTIPARSQVCPECAAQLIGKPEEASRDPERQGYNDFVERYRVESKKELGDNYSEGAFWDWWKRQPTYLAYSQWKLQQQQGTRAGMGAPPMATAAPAAPTAAQPPRRPPGSVPPGAAAARPMTAAQAPPPAAPRAPPAASPAPAQPASAQAAMKPCSNCGKEIPPEYLVCPFCGAVTQ
ncbi:MAG TPA: zinc ribbon domain-containing protein [Thermoplasmata archaeon]|nr:zinc ribbon domain-containing protein [Thermoplasmata archaeon]